MLCLDDAAQTSSASGHGYRCCRFPQRAPRPACCSRRALLHQTTTAHHRGIPCVQDAMADTRSNHHRGIPRVQDAHGAFPDAQIGILQQQQQDVEEEEDLGTADTATVRVLLGRLLLDGGVTTPTPSSTGELVASVVTCQRSCRRAWIWRWGRPSESGGGCRLGRRDSESTVGVSPTDRLTNTDGGVVSLHTPCSRHGRRSPRRGPDLELAAQCDGGRRRRRLVGRWGGGGGGLIGRWGGGGGGGLARRWGGGGGGFVGRSRRERRRPKVMATVTRPGQAKLRENARIERFQETI